MALLYFILFMAFLPVSEMQTFGITIEGEAFVVRCPNANDSEAVNWQFGDTSVSIDPTARVHSSGSKLWFLPASPEDTGDYTCVRYQYYPQVTKTVKVRVHPRVEGICYYKDALDIQARGSRGSGRIVCAPYRDYYNASDMKWYKDCQLLYGSRYKIANKFLYISDANENDNGYYTCEFTYSHDGKKFTVSATRAFKIVELSSPRPIEVLSPIDDKEEVEIGASKTLLCKAWLGLGKQILALSRWEHEGENDSNRFVTSNRSDVISGKGQFTEATLEIKKVRKEDLGTTFTCILANDRGYKKVNVTLVAKGTVKGHSNTYVIVVFVILMVVIMILVMVYRFFRVDIVLWYRRVFNCTGSKDDGKIHDAYVIYPTNHINATYENNFMGSFVHQILPEILENQCGYKLCIYGRDVLPGEDAIDAIENRIQNSRRLIILLTKQLARNEHIAYEHQIALYNALIRNNVKVILLEMEKMGEYAQLQDSLRHIIHQQGTIKWKAKYMACPFMPNSAFWKHVEYQMPLRRSHCTVNSAYHLL